MFAPIYSVNDTTVHVYDVWNSDFKILLEQFNNGLLSMERTFRLIPLKVIYKYLFCIVSEKNPLNPDLRLYQTLRESLQVYFQALSKPMSFIYEVYTTVKTVSVVHLSEGPLQMEASWLSR